MMRAILLHCFLLFNVANFFSILKAQTDTLFIADLNQMSQLSEKFSLYNLDRFQPDNNQLPYTFSNKAWIKENVPIYSHNGQAEYYNFALSTSLYLDGIQSNDWLITQAITLPSQKNALLSWSALAFNTTNADGYEVRIFTTLPDSNDLENTSTLLLEVLAEKDRITKREIPLNAYKGQTVYIAFVNKSAAKYILGVKDIKVETKPDYALIGTSLDNIYEYCQMPFSQFNIDDAYITIKNTGNKPLENLNLNYYVKNNMGVEIHRRAENNIIPLLNVGDSALVNIGNFTPHSYGRYTIVYSISNQQAYFEDSKTMTIRQSFSRAAADMSERAYIIGQNNNKYGSSFKIRNREAPSEITAHVLSGSNATAITGFIYNVYPDGSPWSIVAKTDTLSIHQQADGDYTLTFINPATLIPGDYIMVVEQIGGKLNLAFSYKHFMPNTNWFRVDNNLNGWVTLESLGASYDMAPMLYLAMEGNECTGIQARIYEENDTLKTETFYAVHPLTYTWFTGEQSAFIPNPTGSYYYLTITDANNCTYATYFTRTPSNTSEINESNVLKVYPNPADKIIHIAQDLTSINENINVNILSIEGKKMASFVYNNLQNWQKDIDIKDYPTGVYIIHIQNDKDSFTRKFIKQ